MNDKYRNFDVTKLSDEALDKMHRNTMHVIADCVADCNVPHTDILSMFRKLRAERNTRVFARCMAHLIERANA